MSYVYQRVGVAFGGVEADIRGAGGRRRQPVFRVRVLFTGGKGNAETLTSNATAAAVLALGGRSGSAHPSLSRQGAARRPRLRLFWTSTRVARWRSH